MHREQLLNKLARYQSFSVNEKTSAQKLENFVRTNRWCFDSSHPPRRDQEPEDQMGHITGSAWLLSPDRKKVLLTHHRKLNMWLQLGGHSDGCNDVLETALREAREESGIENVRALSQDIFDLDIHLIPASKNNSAHLHYDIRFLLISPTHENFATSAESRELKWVALHEIENYTREESILRMLQKSS